MKRIGLLFLPEKSYDQIAAVHDRNKDKEPDDASNIKLLHMKNEINPYIGALDSNNQAYATYYDNSYFYRYEEATGIIRFRKSEAMSVKTNLWHFLYVYFLFKII